MRIIFNLIISHGIYTYPSNSYYVYIYSFMMCTLRDPSLEIAVRPLMGIDRWYIVYKRNVCVYNIEQARYSANENIANLLIFMKTSSRSIIIACIYIYMLRGPCFMWHA